MEIYEPLDYQEEVEETESGYSQLIRTAPTPSRWGVLPHVPWVV
jgi:hypothetical protein